MNTNLLIVWAGMLCQSHALELEQQPDYGLGMRVAATALTRTRALLWLGEGCCASERHSGVYVQALATAPAMQILAMIHAAKFLPLSMQPTY